MAANIFNEHANSESDLKLTDIMNLEEIQHIQDLFSQVTGVSSVIVSPDGKPITQHSNSSPLCKIIQSTEKGSRNCMLNLLSSNDMASFSVGEKNLNKCGIFGLMDFSVEIKVEHFHLANWLIGQVRTVDLTEDKMLQYADEIETDGEEMRKTFHQMPVMSEQQFDKVCELLQTFADQISGKSYFNYQLQKKIREEENTNKLLRQAHVIAELGTYVIDLDAESWTSSEVLDIILGIDVSYDKTIKNWLSLIHPDFIESVVSVFRSEIAERAPRFNKEYRIVRHLDNVSRWVHVVCEMIYSETGQLIRVIGTMQDVTGRKESEDALRKSEEKYRIIFETIRDVFYQITLDGIILEISPSITLFSGYLREHLLGRSVLDFYARSYEREIFIERLMATGEVENYEVGLVKDDGSIADMSINARLVFDNSGVPLYIEGVMHDVSKRRKVETALRESEEKLRSYFDYSPYGVFVTDQQGKCIEVNFTASVITGFTYEELCSIDPFSIVSNESISDYMHHQEKVRVSETASDELVLVRKNRKKVYCRLETVRLGDDRYLSFVSDITERRKAEEAIVRSQKFLLETQMIAQLGNYSINVKTGTWESSEMLDNILGIDPQFEKNIHSWEKIVHPEWKEKVQNYFLYEVIGNKSRLDIKFKIIKFDNGEVRWLHALGKHKYDIDGNLVAIIGTIQDITERKNTAEALRASEALYRSVLETSPDAILVVETNGLIRMASSAAVKMYGSDDDYQMIGLNMFDLLVPEDRDSARLELSLLFDGESSSIVEYRVVRVDKTIIFAEIRGGIIRNRENLPTAIVLVIRDVTERKNVEIALKNSQEQLKAFARHLENVREEERRALAREIHDELGQILVAVKIDLGLARQQLAKLGNVESLVPVIKNYHNLAGIIDNMINTTRRIMTNLRPEILDLVGFTEAAKNYVHNFEKRYMIKCNFNNYMPKLELDPQRSLTLYRILQESLSNVAKHAKATNVNIIVRQHGEKVIMEIADNGIGFDQTKKVRADSYGLIGMKERVFLLEGDFYIVSQEGVGTSIRVQIPYK